MIDDARDQRCLGADDRQSDAFVKRQPRERVRYRSGEMSTLRTPGSACRARVAGRNEDLFRYRGAGAFPGQRMFTPAVAYDAGLLIMPEVSHARENHGQAVFVGGADDLVVAYRPTGLNDRGDAGLRGGVDPVAEREESVRGHDGAGDVESLVGGFDRSDLRTVDAAHLAGTDTDGHPVPAEYDRIRLDEFDNRPCEQHVLDLARRRRTLCDDVEIGGADPAGIVVLHEQAARHLLEVEALPGIAGFAGPQHAQVLLGAQDRGGILVHGRNDDHLDKLAVDDRPRRGRVERHG